MGWTFAVDFEFLKPSIVEYQLIDISFAFLVQIVSTNWPVILEYWYILALTL